MGLPVISVFRNGQIVLQRVMQPVTIKNWHHAHIKPVGVSYRVEMFELTDGIYEYEIDGCDMPKRRCYLNIRGGQAADW